MYQPNNIYQEHSSFASFQQQINQMKQTSVDRYADMVSSGGSSIMMPVAPVPSTMTPFTYNTNSMWQEHQNYTFLKSQQQQQLMSGLGGMYYSQGGGFSSSIGQVPISQLPRQFLDSQLQGLYTGLGITPQVMDTMNRHIFNPAAGQVGHAMSLTSAMTGAMFSKMPLYMSTEQRSELSNLLATNITSTGLSVGGGITSLAAGAGGLYAGAKVISKLGFWPLAGIAGAGYVGEKLFFDNNLMPSLTGGKYGGWNKNILPTRWFSHFKEEVAEDEALSQLLSRESYRFMSSTAPRSMYNLGLSRENIQEWSTDIRGWDTKFKMSDSEVQGILSSVISNDLIRGVGTDIDDFESRFGDMVQYIKNASKVLNKSYEEVTDMIAEFKRVGIQPGNFDLKAAELKSYASLLGKHFDTVKDFMLGTTELHTRGTGLESEKVYKQLLFGSGVMNIVYEESKANNDVFMRNLIDNMGGAMGASGVVWQGAQQVLSGQAARGVLSNLYTKTADGEFILDTKALDDMYSRTLRGELSTANVPTPLRGWDDNDALSFLNATRSGQLFLNQDESSVLKQVDMMIKLTGNTGGLTDISDSNILTSVYGLDPNVAKLMERYSGAYSEHGAELALSQYFLSNQIVSAADMEIMRRELISGNYQKSTEFMDSLATGLIVKPFKHTLQNYIEDTMNRNAGLPSIDLMEHSVSRFDYVLDPKEFRSTYVDPLEALDIGKRMKTILEENPVVMGQHFKVGLRDLGTGFDVMTELVGKAYEEGRINWVESKRLKGSIFQSVNTPAGAKTFDDISSERLWKLFTDKKGNLIDLSDIEGSEDLLYKLTLKGILSGGDNLELKNEEFVQNTLLDTVTAEMKERSAIKDRAKIAQKAGFDMFALLRGSEDDFKHIAKTYDIKGLTTEDASKALGDLTKTIERLAQDGDLSELGVVEGLESALEGFVGSIKEAGKDAETVLTGFYKSKLTEEADVLLGKAGSNEEAQDAIGAYKDLAENIGSLTDVFRVLEERSLLSEEYSLGKVDGSKAVDEADKVIQDYKEATDKYYGLVEDRIKTLNTRVTNLEGRDTTNWMRSLFPFLR